MRERGSRGGGRGIVRGKERVGEGRRGREEEKGEIDDAKEGREGLGQRKCREVWGKTG